MSATAWDPVPLARAVVADRAAPPVLLLAAWKCLYLGDCTRLTDLAYRAAALKARDGAAT